MSNEKTGSATSASRALEPTETNPLDFVPDKIPFDTPYGSPISLDRAQTVIQAAVAEAKKRNWKMNVAVVDLRRQPRRLSTNGRRDACLHPDGRAQGTSGRDLPARNEAVRGRRPAYASQLFARVRWDHCLPRRHPTRRTGDDYRRNRCFRRYGFPGRNRQRRRRGRDQPARRRATDDPNIEEALKGVNNLPNPFARRIQ